MAPASMGELFLPLVPWECAEMIPPYPQKREEGGSHFRYITAANEITLPSTVHWGFLKLNFATPGSMAVSGMLRADSVSGAMAVSQELKSEEWYLGPMPNAHSLPRARCLNAYQPPNDMHLNPLDVAMDKIAG
ncbi:unnamed protein product [Merluccius merluccius]